MSTLNPYVRVEKRPLYASDSMKSGGFTVRVADDTDPTGWKEAGVVSEDYLLVPNAEVRSIAEEIADRSQFNFEEEKIFFDGKRYSLALVARNEGLVEPLVGDFIGLGLLFENSYDGSRKLAASLFAYRLACKNGMLVPSLFRQVRFKHLRSSSGWQGDVNRALSMLAMAPAGLEKFARASRKLASMRISAGRLREIRQKAVPKLPVTLWGRTLDRFVNEESLDGFGLLNAVTYVTWHDEKPSASTFGHNEYASTGLVNYALSLN